MQILSLVWGILALFGFLTAVVPCLGWLNWLNIPFASVGLVLSIIAFLTGRPGERAPSTWGIVLCAIAVIIGSKRLILGAGIL